MYKHIIIALAFLVAVSNAQEQELRGWIDCGTTMARDMQIWVRGCHEAPCRFVRGDTYRLQISATATAASDTLDYELVVNFMGLFIPLTTGEGCRSLTQGQCPATPNNRFSYVLDYTVPPLPDVAAYVQLHVFHHEGEKGVCVRVPVAA